MVLSLLLSSFAAMNLVYIVQNLQLCTVFTSKMLQKFVQSIVDDRREGDENSLFGVVAETMKLLGNSSYGYQIMDRPIHHKLLK